MLAGDFIARALRRLGSSFRFDFDAPGLTLEELDPGGTDPGNIAEFLTYSIPFEVEPATGFVFPAEVDNG